MDMLDLVSARHATRPSAVHLAESVALAAPAARFAPEDSKTFGGVRYEGARKPRGVRRIAGVMCRSAARLELVCALRLVCALQLLAARGLVDGRVDLPQGLPRAGAGRGGPHARHGLREGHLGHHGSTARREPALELRPSP
eukprot:7382777-Prymnesium_polylepis.2